MPGIIEQAQEVRAVQSAPSFYPAPSANKEVTREEIQHTERILSRIDRSNAVLNNASQWLLIWGEIRELSTRVMLSPKQAQESVLGDFCALLKDAIRLGEVILSLMAEQGITSQHLALYTRCDTQSLKACVTFLEDRLLQFTDTSVSDEVVARIWAGQTDEPV